LWPLYSAFDRYRRCSSPACSVCTQPLRNPGLLRAPWSPAACTRLPSLIAVPPLPGRLCSQSGVAALSATFVAFRPVAFASRVPTVGLSHSLAFDSLTPCEVGDILRCGCYPCLIQAESEPPGRLPPAPGSYIHRSFPLPVELCGQLGRAGLSAAFAAFRPVALTLRTHPWLM
jgi:hypothetical protein